MQFYDLSIFEKEMDDCDAVCLEQTLDEKVYDHVIIPFDQAEIVAQEILRLVKENKEKKEV